MEFSFQTASTHSSVSARLRSLDHASELMDNSFIEVSIMYLFKIDIKNYIQIKAILAKQFHIQPSELDNMPVWEYEIFVGEINDMVKEENAKNKAEMDKVGYDKIQKITNNPNKLGNMSSIGNFKMPDTGSFKMPNM